MLGAREVNLLIADFSGRAVVRLTSTDRVHGARNRGSEQAETVPLAGTAYDRVLRTQQADVQPVGDGARMVVPVTTRGDAIGLLELVLPRTPSPERWPTSAAPLTRWPTSRWTPAGTPTCS